MYYGFQASVRFIPYISISKRQKQMLTMEITLTDFVVLF